MRANLKSAFVALLLSCPAAAALAERPNILLCISDDQSYAHTGANGDPVVNTPAFDRIAREGARRIPYGEVDMSPTKTFMMRHRDLHGVAHLAQLAFGMRPAEELYDLRIDPAQLRNLAGSTEALDVQQSLRRRLFDHLRTTNDPRVSGGPVNWDHYPYYGWIHPETKDWSVDPKP